MTACAHPAVPPRVAIRVARGNVYGDNVLRGIAAYSSTQASWRFVDDPAHAQASPAGLNLRACEGVIAYATKWADLHRYLALGVPVVNTTGRDLDRPCARVCTDNTGIARSAAAHLLGLGLRRVFALHANHSFQKERAASFLEFAGRLGGTATQCGTPTTEADWRGFAQRVRSGQGPAGVFCATDTMAHELILHLREAGADVPQDVAVLGCGNDVLTCTFSEPEISSVDTDAFTVGYRAGELLDRMMRGEVDGTPTIRVPPAGVVERDSTAVLAVDDPALAEAVRFVRNHACKGIDVSAVMARSSLNRKALERGFRRAVGRTPLQEIRRVQLDAARQMLAQTDQSIERIAQRIGLRDGRYLSQVFRKAEGVTPTAYRAAHRRPA